MHKKSELRLTELHWKDWNNGAQVQNYIKKVLNLSLHCSVRLLLLDFGAAENANQAEDEDEN